MIFINLLCFSIIRKNKLLLLIVILLFSLISMYMPHGLVETYEHHDYESLVKHVINNNKPSENLKRSLKKLRSLLLKLVRLLQLLENIVVLEDIRLVLFNMHFSKVSILQLFSFLYFYFYGSKYKHSRKYSNLLPLMAL